MSATAFELLHTGPGPGAHVASASTSSAAVDLSAYTKVEVYFTKAVHIRFGSASVGAATSDDMLYADGERMQIDIVPGKDHFRVIRDTADGVVYYAGIQ